MNDFLASSKKITVQSTSYFTKSNKSNKIVLCSNFIMHKEIEGDSQEMHNFKV